MSARWKIAEDQPHGKLPPVRAGDIYTTHRIYILKKRLNQHAVRFRTNAVLDLSLLIGSVKASCGDQGSFCCSKRGECDTIIR
jgi:hypothetical protein